MRVKISLDEPSAREIDLWWHLAASPLHWYSNSDEAEQCARSKQTRALTVVLCNGIISNRWQWWPMQTQPANPLSWYSKQLLPVDIVCLLPDAGWRSVMVPQRLATSARLSWWPSSVEIAISILLFHTHSQRSLLAHVSRRVMILIQATAPSGSISSKFICLQQIFSRLFSCSFLYLFCIASVQLNKLKLIWWQANEQHIRLQRQQFARPSISLRSSDIGPKRNGRTFAGVSRYRSRMMLAKRR